MLAALYPWLHLVGRILFTMIFISSGINHFTKLGPMAAYAGSRRVPMPKVTVPITGLIALVGGVLVLLGWHRFIGAGLLALFLLLTAFLMHNFWIDTDPMRKQTEMVQFMKNIALTGAALFIMVYSGMNWPMSLGG